MDNGSHFRVCREHGIALPRHKQALPQIPCHSCDDYSVIVFDFCDGGAEIGVLVEYGGAWARVRHRNSGFHAVHGGLSVRRQRAHLLGRFTRPDEFVDATPADDVEFEDSVAGKVVGAENVKAFLSGFLPAINDVKIIQHVCEGEYVATHWEVDAVFGIIPIMEKFRVQDGKITEAIGYFDPRPVLGS